MKLSLHHFIKPDPPKKEEIWRPVLGYEGLYEASNSGQIKSTIYPNHHRILKQSLSGYRCRKKAGGFMWKYVVGK